MRLMSLIFNFLPTAYSVAKIKNEKKQSRKGDNRIKQPTYVILHIYVVLHMMRLSPFRDCLLYVVYYIQYEIL
jgi:hypothetical protein